MKKIKKILAVGFIAATISGMAFATSGCSTSNQNEDSDTKMEQSFPDDDQQNTDFTLTGDDIDEITELQDNLLRKFSYDTSYTVLSVDGFSGNAEKNSWEAYTTARPSGDKSAKTYSLVFSGEKVKEAENNYVQAVTESIEACNTEYSADNIIAVFNNISTLLDNTDSITYSTTPELTTLYDNGATAEQKTSYFTLVRSFCDEKSAEDDKYNEIMGNFYINKSKMGEIKYAASSTDGGYNVVMQQSAKLDDNTVTLTASFKVTADAINKDMCISAIQEYIKQEGKSSNINVKTTLVGQEIELPVTVELTDVAFSSTALEDLSKTVFNNIKEKIETAKNEVVEEAGI